MTRRGIAYLAMVVAVVAAGLYGVGAFSSSDDVHMSAIVTEAKGIYVGDDVRILGVRVGEITHIIPEGTDVRIEFTLPASRKVPADADAVILAPSLVASRFLQLTPIYSSGPTLGNGGTIPLSRTAVPEEFDDVKAQLTRLADALGPKGGALKSSLDTVINVANANLGGDNAQRLKETITALSSAASALSSGRGDLFTTIKSLNSFVINLVSNDAAVRTFSQQLATVSGQLDNDSSSLTLAIDTVDNAFEQVTSFLKTNTAPVNSAVTSLADLSSTLAAQTNNLEQVLHVAPTALANFYNIQDPRYGALTGALSLAPFEQGASSLVCGAIAGLTADAPDATSAQIASFKSLCSEAVSPLAQLLGVGNSLLPNGKLPIPGSSSASSGSTSAGSATPGSGAGGTGISITSAITGLVGLLLPGGGK